MPAGFSHLRVQLGQLLLIQVGLLVNTGLVSELRPRGGGGGDGRDKRLRVRGLDLF